MELEGFKVLVAENRKKGIELATECMPDLIICDVLMAGMDGHEVLHLLLDNAKTHEIAFIFSTPMSEKIDKSRALELGADDYIAKPFESESLLKMARTWIKSGSQRPVTSISL
jgi:CheY-like chemotaxis protein